MANNTNIKKVCSFYASDWHLVTMLLPNVNKKINEGIRIATILEQSLEQKINTLLEKLKIENKQKILNIKWNKTQLDEIKDIVKENDEIFVNGSIEYIEKIHRIIEKIEIKEDKIITIIDCYDFEKSQANITQILEKHDKILNTSGERDKTEKTNNLNVSNI